jgi:transposase
MEAYVNVYHSFDCSPEAKWDKVANSILHNGIHCPAPDHGRLLWECATTFPIDYRHLGGWSILSGRNYTRSLIQYTADFKAKVAKEMLREEKTVGQLAAEYEVHSNMLYRWREQMLAGLPGLFSDQAAQELAEKEAQWEKEREALYAEIGRLTTQLTWVEKKSRGLLK